MNFLKQQYDWRIIIFWIITFFFLAEFFLYFFGTEALEHVKIFILSRDRYIATYALTIAGLALLVSRDFHKYKDFFYFSMPMMAMCFAVASLIHYEGRYSTLFPVINLNETLSGVGAVFLSWYLLTSSAFYFKK